MTPKDKAYELFKIVYEEHGLNTNCIEISKRIAIKMVEQIILSNPTIKGNSKDLITMIVQTKSYYALVISELEQL